MRCKISARWCRAQRRCIAIAVGLAECVSSGGQGDDFLVVHGHAFEGFAKVARSAFIVMRVAAGAFGIDVDETHLDRGERPFDLFETVFRGNACLHAFVDPFVFASPVDVAFRFEHVGTATAKAEDRSAHAFDRDIACHDEQVGPADVLAVLLLHRPQQAARLVEIAIIRPAVERREALLPAIGAAASVGSAIGACRMPRHADEERTVMAVICRPPWLAVGHQRVEIIFQRLVIERIEGLGIIEVVAHRV